MARKFLISTLIVFSSTLLVLCIPGIVLAWVYNEPLTRESTSRMEEVDSQLAQLQTDLRNTKAEVERALRIVESAEQALNKLTQADPQAFFANVQTTLDDGLLPELETAKERLITARDTLEGLRSLLFAVQFIPFVEINIPDQMLTDLIDSADSLQTEIVDVKKLVEQASTFISDTSFLLGGDFDETKQQLEDLLLVLTEYDQKAADWREQIAKLIESTPRWIDNASLSLTVALLWFGFSQFGLILHGLGMKRGVNPLDVLRTKTESSA